jgi:hypothetical protein
MVLCRMKMKMKMRRRVTSFERIGGGNYDIYAIQLNCLLIVVRTRL